MILDGKLVAEKIQLKIQQELKEYDTKPCIGIVNIGNNITKSKIQVKKEDIV